MTAFGASAKLVDSSATPASGPLAHVRARAGLHAWQSFEVCPADDPNALAVYVYEAPSLESPAKGIDWPDDEKQEVWRSHADRLLRDCEDPRGPDLRHAAALLQEARYFVLDARSKAKDQGLLRTSGIDWPDDGEIEAWLRISTRLLETMPRVSTPDIRQAAFLLQNVYLFVSDAVKKARSVGANDEAVLQRVEADVGQKREGWGAVDPSALVSAFCRALEAV